MKLNVLHLKSHFIYDQLQLEEALLRTDTNNWCLINEGSPPAIVMGISGRLEELVDQAKAAEQNIPLIKRFSGGGTVVVDEETLFVTFIFQKEVHSFPCFPEAIMRWSEGLYRPLFPSLPFALRENDYCIADRKCGGNAQYIKKDRWLLHTSFLWDFKSERMRTLLHPKRVPQYRQNRSHEEFLCTLKEIFPHKDSFVQALKNELSKHYTIQSASVEEALTCSLTAHRQSTLLV